jgi:TrmH family RNA methyltransferase
MQTSCKIILVHPRDPKNIGAAARAMKNFGLTELAVVAPFAPNWNEAVSAVNAADVLTNAQVCVSLAEAVADCTFVVGTADRTRIAGKHRSYTPRDLQAELAATPHRLALVFGSEKHGLTNDDLTHCHRTMSLPTAPDCPSMNLGQAVAVCCYELTRAETPLRTGLTTGQLATAGEVEVSLQLLLKVLRAAQFVGPSNAATTTNNLRQRLLRLGLTAKDVKLLCGALRQIQWRFEHK